MSFETGIRKPTGELSGEAMFLIFVGIVAMAVLGYMAIAGHGTAHKVGVWLGGLGMVALVVAAIVGSASASWAAGRRVANVGTGAHPRVRADALTGGAPNSVGGPVAAELAELARLHREGALTAEEFAAAKPRSTDE